MLRLARYNRVREKNLPDPLIYLMPPPDPNRPWLPTSLSYWHEGAGFPMPAAPFARCVLLLHNPADLPALLTSSARARAQLD